MYLHWNCENLFFCNTFQFLHVVVVRVGMDYYSHPLSVSITMRSLFYLAEIITDQFKTFSAIRKVLSHTCHRWCIWHILKKISQNLGKYARFKELNAKLSYIVWNSRLVKSFEDDWAKFIDKYNLDHNTWLLGSII
ncbi:hypothetical protein Ahy_B10g102584 [Arachis hypogaea]|uniref:Uncharacterized protein n=1 Tax=Arachis hypogaea TaxID=3818 RepID=A0A444X258_ARAHY|nr:hypothetical protein Ahy_B10g102584 [Arachis hypogaea]